MFFITGLIILITLVNIIVYYLRLQHEEEQKQVKKHNLSLLSSSGFQCRQFSLAEIEWATQNFDAGLVIGKGGFGEVYKGIIDNGATTVAIKRLGFWSKQGALEFWTEIEMLSNFRHSHLVSLVGYCNDHTEMIIAYEYMPGGTLADNLHKISGSSRRLSWIQRLKVCLGAARGLDYLHTGTDILTRVIHRDVKSSNILLDENLEAKISDFGLSKVGPAEQLYTHVSTHVKGTFGYMDPEYFLTHRLTRKSDVYAFGVVMFEALCGRAAVDTRLDEERWGLAKWVKRCIKEGKLHEIVDPHLNGSILLDCLKAFAQIAEQCLHESSKKRPTMAEVVTRLEYALSLQEMTTFSLMDAEVISNGGVYDNQEGVGSSIETEVRDAGDGNFSTLNNNGSVEYNDKHTAIRSQSSIHAAKKVTFAKQVRLFFSTNVPAKAPTFTADSVEVYSESFKLKRFSLLELQVATDNFSDKCILGRGGFGNTYKGCWDDGSLVAIKRLVEGPSRARELKFQNEVEIISLALHQNLLQLLGFCTTSTERLLVYPYMANGSVASRLRALPESPSALDWKTRKRIAVGSAKGLACLHEDYIIHHNIGAASVFLDEFSDVVIGNFGLAQHRYQNVADFTALVIGKSSYLAPEYHSTGMFSRETDVYGYGVMLIELITGPRHFDLSQRAIGHNVRKLNWVRESKFQVLVDKNLLGNYVEKEVERLMKVALLCTHGSSVMRPKMSEVVRMLQGDGLAKRWEVYQKKISPLELEDSKHNDLRSNCVVM